MPEIEMIDITAPEGVEITIDHHRNVVWVNVDGMCRLRICRAKHITVAHDYKQEAKEKAE